MKGIRGFTFVELIIVLAIFGIIFVVVLLPIIKGDIGCSCNGTGTQTQASGTMHYIEEQP